MTIKEYQDLAMRTNDGKSTDRLSDIIGLNIHCNNYHRVGELLNGALGLTGEAGEVADEIKKHIFHGHRLDLDAICKELGDVMWYIALICSALNISLEYVMTQNINKLMERYPEGFSSEASKHRKV